MKIIETKTQFIKEEEGIVASEEMKTYSLTFTSDMNSSYRMDFPQYELFFRAFGGWGHASYLTLNYRGVTISPNTNENRETFILNLLNDLKKGNYTKKMKTFFKQRFKEDKFKTIESILNTDNIKVTYLERELASLKDEVTKLRSIDQNKVLIELKEENIKLTERLDNIKELMK